MLRGRSEGKETEREAGIECGMEVAAKATRALPTRTSENVQTPPRSLQLQKGRTEAPPKRQNPKELSQWQKPQMLQEVTWDTEGVCGRCPSRQQHTWDETLDPPCHPISDPSLVVTYSPPSYQGCSHCGTPLHLPGPKWQPGRAASPPACLVARLLEEGSRLLSHLGGNPILLPSALHIWFFPEILPHKINRRQSINRR